MLIRLLPGANPRAVAAVLREIAIDASNARNTTGRLPELIDAYLRWANLAATQLRNQVTPNEVNRLVLTPVYYAMITLTREPTPMIGSLISRELDERIADIEAARSALEGLERRWPFETFVVADTSVFMQHTDKLEDWDFHTLIGVRHHAVHLLVPMLVVDQLDGLKQSRNESRWRAGYSLAVIERVVSAPDTVGLLRAGDSSPLDSGGMPSGAVTVEVVSDPPGHARLPIDDDEIIDRAVAVQLLAAKPTNFITLDTGQAMRARATPLTVKKLKMPKSKAIESSPGKDNTRGDRA